MIVFLVLIIIISWKINSFDSEVRAFICGVENLKIYLLLVSLKIFQGILCCHVTIIIYKSILGIQ